MIIFQKAAFFDWDGTLSTDGLTTTPENRLAIARFQQAGGFAFLCTGRSIGYIPPHAKTMGFDGFVAGMGAYITYGDRLLRRRFIPHDLLCQLCDHFARDGQTCILEGEQEMLALNAQEKPEWPHLRDAADFEARFPGHVITKLTLYGETRPATLALLTPAMSLIRHPLYLEAVPLGCSKSDGMRLVTAELGLSLADSWAFGDSPNDVDMLRAAAVGVAMGDATDEVKASAHRVTLSAKDSGVGVALEQLLREFNS